MFRITAISKWDYPCQRATVRLHKGNELIETYTIPVKRKGNTCQMLILDNEGR